MTETPYSKFVRSCSFTLAFTTMLLGMLILVGCGDDTDDEVQLDGDNESETESEVEQEMSTDGDQDADSDGDPDVEEEVEEEGPPPEVLPFEPAGPDAAPDPMSWGPWPVGVMTIDFTDNSRLDPDTGEPRFLRTEIWYPVKQEYADGPFFVLNFKEEAADAPLGDKREVIMNADLPNIDTRSIRDAEIDISNGPYPLVFFSHGANGIRWQSVFHTIQLASHGYIVVSPDHQYNTIWEIISGGFQADSLLSSLAVRPQDMSFLLDRMEEYNEDPANMFFDSMDMENIGATGHSLGGITSTIMPCVDERFKAVSLHSPNISAGLMMGSCGWENYPVPSITMGGTLDGTLPYCTMYCDYKNYITGDQPKYLYELVAGGHFTFSDICRLDLIQVAEELEMGNDATNALNDGCADYNAPFEEAQQTINHYATAFFNAYLRGSDGSLDYLIEIADEPFDSVNFFEGDVPDFWEEGGCEACGGLGR